MPCEVLVGVQKQPSDYKGLGQANYLSISPSHPGQLCNGVLLDVNHCQEIMDFLIPSAGNYFVTIM